MLTTPNFKLKKIELTDSPPDITVINPNWDTLDTNLKEALDGARGWDTFSKNGGTIEGKVTLGTGQDKGLYFGSNFRTWGGTDEWYVRGANGKGLSLSATSLRTSDPDNMTLGTTGAPWKDVFLGGLSKNLNGYTKLPNGLLLQWGTVSHLSPNFVGGQSVPDQSLSVAFPARLIGCCAYAYYVEGGYAGQIHTKCLSDGNLTKISIHSHFFENLGGKRVYYRWFAFGY